MSRVYVLGNAGLDLGLRLPRVPTLGETLVGSHGFQAPGGKGLNQAVAAARAGAAVHFMAPVGPDVEAEAVRTALAAEPLASLSLPILALPTDRSILMLLPDGENCIVSLGECADALDPLQAAAFAGSARAGDILLVQGNLSAAATRAAAAACAGRVMLNTAPLRWDVRPLLPYCAVVVANRVEATTITGHASAVALYDAGAAVAVVTLGAEGCLVADASGERHFPASPARLVDSTGAGDAFCGTLAAQLAAGWPFPDAIAAAQRVAARTVERSGAYAALPPRMEWPALLAADEPRASSSPLQFGQDTEV